MPKSLVLASVLLLSSCSLGSDPSDGSSPLISIDEPLHDAVVGGQVSIAATVTDDFGVDEVRILIGPSGTQPTERTKLFTGPFVYIWNSRTVPDNSSHEIRVEATDRSGNVGFRSIRVTVQNGLQ